MDVRKGRTLDDVIILGSGLSILDLTKDEVEYINKCKVVIALNKFTAFYKKSKLLPTHIFFLDYSGTSFYVLKYIIEVCRKDKLENLSLVLDESFRYRFYKYFPEIFILWFKHNKKHFYDFYKGTIRRSFFKVLEFPSFCKIPKNSNFLFTRHGDMMKGGEWANNFEMPLFHYRGSLSSVLNYAGIITPNNNVFLVGTDFNSGTYFFQDELAQSDFNKYTPDWTTPLVKEHNNHFSVIDINGTTIYDKLPFMLDKLKLSGNNVYCNNVKSDLVVKGYIEYKKLPA